MGTLDLMFQNGMKASGSMALGQQLPIEQQTNQAGLQAQLLANQSNAQMNPLRAQFMQGQIDQQQAQLPGMVGQSQSQVAQGQYDTDTNAQRIAGRLSDITNQIGVNGVQKMGRDGAIASQVGAALAQYPPALHKEVLPKLIEQYGGDPSSPTFQGLMRMPDGQVAKAASTLGKGMAMASADYMQKQSLEAEKNASEERRTKTQAGATVEAARIAADSRVNAAKARIEGMKSTLGTDKTIAMLESQKAQNGGVLPPEYDDELNRLKVQQLMTHPTNNIAPNMTGQPTSYDNARTAVYGNQPQTQVQPQAGPNNSGAVNAPQQIQGMAQQSWGAYEPDKYDYRVGPNGNLQRKPK